MGELGTSAESLENRLGDVLDLCAEWNAIALLDEADVFLEKRNTLDLVQHSMVCVMLRMLEYHSGILFLTTNHVREFDPAIETRVTVALYYPALALDARVQIWNALLQRTSVTVDADVDPRLLGKHVLNGREIKNIVRLAVALTREEKLPTLSSKTLELALQTTSIGKQVLNDRL
jgi:SpoVK/Ycf46/Vps4 family AAA+-type ATPase